MGHLNHLVIDTATMLYLMLMSLIPLPVISFSIVNTTQSSQVVSPEDSLNLICQSDSHWEFCRWTQRRGSEERECLMEWKRAKGGVAVQACDDDLVERVEIAGDYDNNQCGLTLLGVQGEDAGLWECEMEEYQFTDLLGGEKHSHNFTVVVEEKLATVTEITTTEPFETTIDGSEATEENEMTPPHTTTDKQIVTHNIEALPIDQDQTEQQEPDDAPVVGISIGVSLVIVLAAASV